MAEDRLVIGPFSATDLSRLTEILDGAGVTYTVEENPERVEEADQARSMREPMLHPVYEGPAEIFMLIFPKARAALIRDELARIGKPFLLDPPPEINDAPEYHCPVCSFTSDTLQLCPQHRVPLLEFSDWVAARQARSSKANRIFMILLIAIVIGLAIWFKLDFTRLFWRH
jgi:hypothetical protein